MENAADALKIALAIFIFIIGLAILFSMTTQARSTAEFIIAEKDSTSYYDRYSGATDLDSNGNRIVTIKDIVPVLYRYSQENYGVTIIDNTGTIVARFDLDTETACNNWNSASNEIRTKFINSIDNNILEKVKILSGKSINKIATETNMVSLFKKCYKQVTSSTITREYYCYWIANTGCIAQRIDSDLSRTRC